jgi:hypothetical protein
MDKGGHPDAQKMRPSSNQAGNADVSGAAWWVSIHRVLCLVQEARDAVMRRAGFATNLFG